MEPQTRRTLLATAVCFGVLLGYMFLMPKPVPPAAPMPASEPAASTAPAADRGVGPQNIASSPERMAEAPLAEPADAYRVVGNDSAEPVVLGDDRQSNSRTGFVNPYRFAVTVSPLGASIESIALARHRQHVAKHPKNPDHDPYRVLEPIEDPATGRRYASLSSGKLKIDKDAEVDLASAKWSLTRLPDDEKGQAVVLEAVVRRGTVDVLRVRKTYRVEKDSPHIRLKTELENLANSPLDVVLTDYGPVGIHREDGRTDDRMVVSGVIDATGNVKVGQSLKRADAFSAEGRAKLLQPSEGQHVLWYALGDKYFAMIVAPVPHDEKQPWPEFLAQVSAVALFDDKNADNDLSIQSVVRPRGAIPAKALVSFAFDVYCGPKSKAGFEADEIARKRNYYAVSYPDRAGCTSEAISVAMLWLLTFLHGIVRNYGVAIIILTVIVKVLLHPISKRGQVHMMKMQKGMARLKPKLDALQEKYKNDRGKVGEETMKLYREEGVSPAGNILGCLPMFLQIPIWAALWTSLNTNVDLRHAPFFFWMRDLSAPDALIPFSAGYQFKLPLIGGMIGPILGFNLLPVIMAATMYVQNKLMTRMTRPAVPPQPVIGPDGRPVPDTVAQQQKMMSFMMVFMGFIFYNFPSGLCLYILSSNVLGMLEQWRIKTQLKKREQAGEFDVKVQASGAKSMFAGYFERLQKRAEAARMTQSTAGSDSRRRKQRRR